MFLISSTLQPQYIDRLIRSAHYDRIFLITWKQLINRLVARILGRNVVPLRMMFEGGLTAFYLNQATQSEKVFYIS